jgi:hypothetical protein
VSSWHDLALGPASPARRVLSLQLRGPIRPRWRRCVLLAVRDGPLLSVNLHTANDNEALDSCLASGLGQPPCRFDVGAPIGRDGIARAVVKNGCSRGQVHARHAFNGFFQTFRLRGVTKDHYIVRCILWNTVKGRRTPATICHPCARKARHTKRPTKPLAPVTSARGRGSPVARNLLRFARPSATLAQPHWAHGSW